MLRYSVFAALALVHVVLVLWAPEPVAPLIAATVYLPLWPLAAIGLPVFGAAPSGGWAGPSVLGWLVVALLWGVIWWQAARLFGWAWRRVAKRQ